MEVSNSLYVNLLFNCRSELHPTTASNVTKIVIIHKMTPYNENMIYWHIYTTVCLHEYKVMCKCPSPLVSP